MSEGRVIKLFDYDDNQWTIALKMKIESERSVLWKTEREMDGWAVALAGVRNNIAIIKRSLRFLRSKEAKIVIRFEYYSYRSALPLLLKEETGLMNSIETGKKTINATISKIEAMEEEVAKLKFKLIQFRGSR